MRPYRTAGGFTSGDEPIRVADAMVQCGLPADQRTPLGGVRLRQQSGQRAASRTPDRRIGVAVVVRELDRFVT